MMLGLFPYFDHSRRDRDRHLSHRAANLEHDQPRLDRRGLHVSGDLPGHRMDLALADISKSVAAADLRHPDRGVDYAETSREYFENPQGNGKPFQENVRHEQDAQAILHFAGRGGSGAHVFVLCAPEDKELIPLPFPRRRQRSAGEQQAAIFVLHRDMVRALPESQDDNLGRRRCRKGVVELCAGGNRRGRISGIGQAISQRRYSAFRDRQGGRHDGSRSRSALIRRQDFIDWLNGKSL